MKIKINNSLLLIVLMLLIAGINQVEAQISRFSFEKYNNKKGDTLSYRQLYPDSDPFRKYPLVIFLHGSGERGNDNEAQLKWGVMNFATDQAMAMHPSFVIAPQCSENLAWSNFNGDENSSKLQLKSAPSKPMVLLIELIQDIIKKFPIDTIGFILPGSPWVALARMMPLKGIRNYLQQQFLFVVGAMHPKQAQSQSFPSGFFMEQKIPQ